MEKYDFSGWATRNNVKCSDGRTIMKNAFQHNDGETVPLVWNHAHSDPNNVLGHAMLENREEGVYVYGTFNEGESGQQAKKLVQHGDIKGLSIYANQLRQDGNNVVHGAIREVSLVLAGANPFAKIDYVLAHSADSDEFEEEALTMYDDGSELSLSHADSEDKKEEGKDDGKSDEDDGETISDIIDTMNEKQKNAMYYVVGKVIEDQNKGSDSNNNENIEHSEGGNDEMKVNVFDKENTGAGNLVLSHSDETEILTIAKNETGSFKKAVKTFYESNKDTLAHAANDIFVDENGDPAVETLFPEYKDVRPGAPEFIQRDQGWVGSVMSGVHRSPISRIRTRQADIRGTDLRAYGYEKGEEKHLGGKIKLLKRTTDPQTVYRKEALERDDIIDITDFNVVDYMWRVMAQNMQEELAMAFLVGDQRDDGDPDKIYESHIRSIWHDDELYTIHQDVDMEAAKAELQGTETDAHFGESYICAEAIITAALFSREKYKGTGTPDFYCTPHLLNVMLLARDLNGRRIYSSKTDLAAALNVKTIHTVEQFEGLTRTTTDGKKKKLLGLFVNLADYQVGCTKGGEITRRNQFDIDFNQEKYLIETRVSGALTRVFSAIALEEPVTEG